MKIKVGTFNLNNLFSRFNFNAKIDDHPSSIQEGGGLSLTFEQDDVHIRTFMGRLVKAKSEDDLKLIAHRIRYQIDADVLAVQEVEHIEILKKFNRDELHGLYKHIALVEGNDRRLIDVGIMSKYPIGTISSHQTAVHSADKTKRVFSRDLLQIEILDKKRDHLFTIYNTHLKSNYVPYGQDPIQGRIDANERRKRQAEVIAEIIEKMETADSRYILTGDMNDPPDSPYLAPMLTIHGAQLFNALSNPIETRPAKSELPGQGSGPVSASWTHRFNPAGDPPPEYQLYDQIWLSPSLAGGFQSAYIDRRTKHSGDGSDHDPPWIELEL
ncbi:MAG: endonuclease/exonuclease/phosphatase family protein [Spirochaetaceae bacterium]|nr:endonuclease/exonuclease/phosphatase family protein [Spirochaetaceae bacterium]